MLDEGIQGADFEVGDAEGRNGAIVGNSGF